MTTRKKPATGKGQVKGLKLKKETLRDLGAGRQAKNVKGGVLIELGGGSAIVMLCISSLVCPDPPPRKTKK